MAQCLNDISVFMSWLFKQWLGTWRCPAIAWTIKIHSSMIWGNFTLWICLMVYFSCLFMDSFNSLSQNDSENIWVKSHSQWTFLFKGAHEIKWVSRSLLWEIGISSVSSHKEKAPGWPPIWLAQLDRVSKCPSHLKDISYMSKTHVRFYTIVRNFVMRMW